MRPGGLEPPTSWSVARRSIQLSYGRNYTSSEDLASGVFLRKEFRERTEAGEAIE